MGTRTVAGSLILTQFTACVMMRFLESFLQFDPSKDTIYSKVDQLPPLNLSLLFSNEYGFASYQRLLGMRFVMDGTVYSTQDMYTERQITWVASDLTPLLPLTLCYRLLCDEQRNELSTRYFPRVWLLPPSATAAR